MNFMGSVEIDNALWNDWKDHYCRLTLEASAICQDGIVNREEFRTARCRVLFVLKETNDAKGLDLREFLSLGPRGGCWHMIARWTIGLLEEFPPYHEITNDKMKRALQMIAVINLKKLTGGSAADPSLVGAFALRDRHLLHRQIEEIKPDLIVGCGTFEILSWILDLEVNPQDPVRPIRWGINGPWVIPFRHPARATFTHYQELKALTSGIS